MNEIEQQLQRWLDSLAAGDADRVTALYTEDAVLLPTLDGEVKVGHDAIRDYFANGFLPKAPRGTVVELHSRALGDVAVNSGLYDFEVDDGAGGRKTVSARLTFVYHRVGDDWRIVEHHSSLKPG